MRDEADTLLRAVSSKDAGIQRRALGLLLDTAGDAVWTRFVERGGLRILLDDIRADVASVAGKAGIMPTTEEDVVQLLRDESRLSSLAQLRFLQSLPPHLLRSHVPGGYMRVICSRPSLELVHVDPRRALSAASPASASEARLSRLSRLDEELREKQRRIELALALLDDRSVDSDSDIDGEFERRLGRLRIGGEDRLPERRRMGPAATSYDDRRRFRELDTDTASDAKDASPEKPDEPSSPVAPAKPVKGRGGTMFRKPSLELGLAGDAFHDQLAAAETQLPRTQIVDPASWPKLGEQPPQPQDEPEPRPPIKPQALRTARRMLASALQHSKMIERTREDSSRDKTEERARKHGKVCRGRGEFQYDYNR